MNASYLADATARAAAAAAQATADDATSGFTGNDVTLNTAGLTVQVASADVVAVDAAGIDVTGDINATGELSTSTLVATTLTVGGRTLTESIVDAVLNGNLWVLPFHNGYAPAGVGSGSVAATLRHIKILTGATTGSSALWAAGQSSNDYRIGQSDHVDQIDWSKPLRVSVTFGLVLPDANTTFRFYVGKSDTPTIGAPAIEGMGFQVDNTDLKALTHDLTTLTTSASIGTIAANGVYRVEMRSNGAGVVAYYLNGTLVHTTGATGPTKNNATNRNIVCEATNGAGTSSFRASVNQIAFYYQW